MNFCAGSGLPGSGPRLVLVGRNGVLHRTIFLRITGRRLHRVEIRLRVFDRGSVARQVEVGDIALLVNPANPNAGTSRMQRAAAALMVPRITTIRQSRDRSSP